MPLTINMKDYSTPSVGRPRVIWNLQGPGRTSKSSIAFQAPAPHLYLPFDYGYRGVIEKFLPGGESGLNKQIVWPKAGPYYLNYRYEVGNEDAAKVAAKVWERFRADFDKGVKDGFRSITVDTCSEAWHTFVMMRYGKTSQIPQHMWGPLYFEFCNEFRSVLKSDCNVFFIHQTKEEVVDGPPDGAGKKTSKRTGRLIKDGCKKMEYLVESDIETSFREGTFYAKFLNCRQRQGALADTEVELVEGMGFQQLVSLVYPEADPACWDDEV